MRNKIWLINLLLSIGVLVVCVETYGVWNAATGERVYVKGGAGIDSDAPSSKRKAATVPAYSANERIGKSGAYDAMVKKNLFSPDREGRFPEADNAQAAGEGSGQDSGPAVPVALYGTIVTDQYKAALITNPYAGDGENKHQWLKTGESLGEGGAQAKITIDEIYEDRILVTIGSERHELPLHKKKDDAAVVEVTRRQNDNGRQNNGKSGPGDAQGNVEISPDGEYKIIDTPFGKIKRRIR